MNTATKSFSQSIRHSAISGLIMLLISMPASFTIAADLSDVPLFVAVNAPPNVFFELDNSGSMDWEVLTTKHWHACAYDSNYPGGAGDFDCAWYVVNGLWHGHQNGTAGHRYYEMIFDNSDNTYTPTCTGSSNGSSLHECNADINSTPYQNDWRVLSSDMNVMYYNPAQDYEPWDGPCDSSGTPCSEPDFTSARSNPWGGSDGYSLTTDLTGFVYEVWQDDHGFTEERPRRGANLNSVEVAGGDGIIDLWDSHKKYTVNSNSITVETISYAPDASGLNPTTTSTTTLAAGICHPELDNGSSTDGCLTVDQAQKNIATWYQYARKRSYVAKGAIANVVTQNPNFRYGLQMISQDSIMTRMPLKNTTDYASHNKILLENLFAYEWVSNGTRLRQGLENAGQYYDADDSIYVPSGSEENPIIHQCQKCFTILMTDGYWNGDDPSVGDMDSDGISGTLADVARYYYDRDLDSSLANVVPEDDVDKNPRQHMVTFTVAFGVEGNLVDTDGDGNPDPALSENGNWGDPTACSGCPEKIDDMWHAAYNSKGTFISAKTPREVTKGLEDALGNIEARIASAAAVALSAGSIGNDTKIFQAQFDSVDWHGKLYAKGLDSDGTIQAENWEASEQLPEHSARTILSHNGTNPIRFEWSCGASGTTSLSATQQTALNTDINGVVDPASNQLGCERLNYLRGNTSNEVQHGGTFRNRVNGLLGDIVNSQPIYVGNPNFRYPDSFEAKSYSEFKQHPRDAMIYVGSNGGMLHGFSADDGDERVAYVPSMIYDNLTALTSPDYRHKYYVDGTPTAGDAFFDGAWKTVLVGGLGKGGKGVYALDITTPSFGTSSVLWEFTHANLGYSYSRPNIGKMNDGSWAAVFGNGYNNTGTGTAVLFIVDLATGNLLAEIDTGVAGSNGLSTPTLLDTNGDHLIDAVYAGDLQGNLWKFDVSANNKRSWDVAFSAKGKPAPLFTALTTDNSTTPASTVGQPITTRPNISLGPNGTDWMIIFGTGSYLGSSDTISTNVQSVYGILDEGVPVSAGTSVLLEQTILTQNFSSICDEAGTSCTQVELRTTSNNSLQDSHKGWYMNLTDPGERVVNNMVLRLDRLVFVTTVPEQNSCSGGGTSWFMEISPRSGSRLSYPPFDLNGDGEFNHLDQINKTPPTGRRIPGSDDSAGSGLATTPTIGMCNGKECKFTSTTTGEIDMLINDPPFNTGRQSWRQLK